MKFSRRPTSTPRFAPALLVLIWSAIVPGQTLDRFNDDDPRTEALDIWRITHDPNVRHHSNYHNIDPFSPDGRYIIYTIGPSGARKAPTFAVYDLFLQKEIYRASPPARQPVWAHRSATVFWIAGVHPRATGDLWRLQLPSAEATRMNTDLPGLIDSIGYDDRHLFVSGPIDGRGPMPWVLWRVEMEPGGARTILYKHARFPERYSYLARANPARPLLMARQNKLASDVKWTADHPARILLNTEGKHLGTALSFTETSHACWSGDGQYLVRGDGPLRVRSAPFVTPGDWKIVSTQETSDASPCGGSGQWLVGISGINGTIFVADTHSAYTRSICHAASIIHQPKEDKRDLSGPYDSDPHGSPDGTKIYFSTNYAIKRGPVTRTRSRIVRARNGSGPLAFEVESTAGFAESGVLSVWCTLVKYRRKEATRFLGCEWGYARTRLPAAIQPEVLVTDYRNRFVSFDRSTPLAHQAATDVYIAVARRPDAPALVAHGSEILLHPGENHRETARYVFYLDGRRLRDWNAQPDEPFKMEGSGQLTVSAVEWSRLRSNHSNVIIVQGGATIKYVDHPLETSARDAAIEVIRKDGKLVEKRFLTLEGWPSQVLAYRPDETLEKRTLYRSRDVVYAVEVYDKRGRRIEETLYNQEGRVSSWMRFDSGRVVQRKTLKYGIFELHEKMIDDRWVRVR